MKTIDLANTSAEDAIRFAEVAKHIYKAKRLAVLTGAGISCNAGIPDFRLLDGLYDMVKAQHPKVVVRGQDLFDILLFRDEALLLVFCTFMEALYALTKRARPTETHRFIKTLKEKRKLLRCYTQNIDGLERGLELRTGLEDAAAQWRQLDVVQLHGDLHQLLCTLCPASCGWTREYQRLLQRGENPECQACHQKHLERLYLGKRLTGTIGMLRPLIVLYGENHPHAEHLARGLNQDLRARPDLLLIMGTLLKVDGVKKLVRSLAASIHAKGGKTVFVNKTPVAALWGAVIDYQVLSDCDEFVRGLKREIPDLFLTQEEIDSERLAAPATKAGGRGAAILAGATKGTKGAKGAKGVTVAIGAAAMGAAALGTPPATPTKKRETKQEIKHEIRELEEALGFNRATLAATPELTPAPSFEVKEEPLQPLQPVLKLQLNCIRPKRAAPGADSASKKCRV
jgi:NAD-dependent histone deacetylase SIR2